MKKWGYFLSVVLGVSVLGGLSSAGTDVVKLQPVEVVVVQKEEKIRIQTDAGNWGVGNSLEEAIENLHTVTPAEVFLDTAEYVLIKQNCVNLLPELMGYLRPSCAVCLLEGEALPEGVAQFLQIHQPGITLLEYRAGITNIPVLKENEGRMELVS